MHLADFWRPRRSCISKTTQLPNAAHAEGEEKSRGGAHGAFVDDEDVDAVNELADDRAQARGDRRHAQTWRWNAARCFSEPARRLSYTEMTSASSSAAMEAARSAMSVSSMRMPTCIASVRLTLPRAMRSL